MVRLTQTNAFEKFQLCGVFQSVKPSCCGIISKMGGTVGKDSNPLSEHFSNIGMYHCAMIGLDCSGKTTVLYRMKFNQYMNTASTIGFNCEKVRFLLVFFFLCVY